MRILIVEDIEAQGDSLCDALKGHFGPMTEIERVETEEDFYRWHDLATQGRGEALPDVAIIDVMLPYRWPREEDYLPGAPPLPDPGPIDEAGFRCLDHLRNNPRTSSIPAVFYTALPPDVLRKGLEAFPEVPHKRKDGNFPALFELLEQPPGESVSRD